MSPPGIAQFDVASLLGPAAGGEGPRLREALETTGLALLLPPADLRAGVDQALAEAAAFFRSPATVKADMAIARSPHHRGWSVMHNERDWREQVHLGRERPALAAGPSWRRLQGPNPWQPGPGHRFREAMTAHLEACLALGQGLLRALAPAFDLPPTVYDAQDAYGLLKLIAYHPQDGSGTTRRGVAAHVDFSLLTLVAQDGAGGLEARLPDGAWIPVPALPGALVLHVGELLEALSGGTLRATPHRVTHPGRAGPRLSLPVFVNPPLAAWVHPRPAPERPPEGDHVHRVLTGHEVPFRFGEAEWRRKGLNRWCAACCEGA